MSQHKLGQKVECLLFLSSLPEVLHVGKRHLRVFLRDGLGLAAGWVIAEEREQRSFGESHLARLTADRGKLHP